MTKQILCYCGWSVRGTDEELVAATQQHAREAHDMTPTAAQVLAVATPVTDTGTGDGHGSAPAR